MSIVEPPSPPLISTPDVVERQVKSRATRKVLHIINGEFYAGAERVQDLLALRLPECGYAVSFACVHPHRFAESRRSQEAPLFAVPMTNKFDLRPARVLAKLVRDEGYELIHTHTARSAMIGRMVSRLTGVPLVHHIHSPTARDSTHRWSNRANVWLERRTLPQAQALIAVSNSLARQARESGLAREKIVVVPNGVPAIGPLSTRSEPKQTWTIGCVALFRPRKGLEVLLDAMAQLVAQGFDLRLRAVGPFQSPEYQQEILAQVARLGLASRIDWRGFQEHVEQEFAAMDLFVLPSLFGEGMPMVVLEAMANGVPIVSTQVEGVPEVIRHGVDGLLAEPGSATSLATEIERLLTGEVDWSALRESAWERHAQHFSALAMAQNVARVYDAVLAGTPPVHADGTHGCHAAQLTGSIEPREFQVLGVNVTDLPFDDAIALLQSMLEAPAARSHVVNFVNAHTLNTACEVDGYREVLNRSDVVFGDGTGVRWAAKLQGIKLRANLNGTDLLPALFDALAGMNYRYFLLGSDRHTIERTVAVMQQRFPSWHCAGYYHGYLDDSTTREVLTEIERTEPHLLLVGMGNPKQELWIERHRGELNARVCCGVGGLLDYLAGKNIRAPLVFRRLGLEWLFVAFTQFRKFNRYLIGNPKFLYRIVKERFANGTTPKATVSNYSSP